MGVLLWVAGVVLLLAYANGANDNFKGVATLRGSPLDDRVMMFTRRAR